MWIHSARCEMKLRYRNKTEFFCLRTVSTPKKTLTQWLFASYQAVASGQLKEDSMTSGNRSGLFEAGSSQGLRADRARSIFWICYGDPLSRIWSTLSWISRNEPFSILKAIDQDNEDNVKVCVSVEWYLKKIKRNEKKINLVCSKLLGIYSNVTKSWMWKQSTAIANIFFLCTSARL